MTETSALDVVKGSALKLLNGNTARDVLQKPNSTFSVTSGGATSQKTTSKSVSVYSALL